MKRPSFNGWQAIDPSGVGPYIEGERLARASASPTRPGPEGSNRNEPRLGRCPASHYRLFAEDTP